jgi:glycosyltransferase involved in cell wall biosynthesis
MTKVSVIIPLYNGKKFIKETLRSVFNQTYKDFEVVIVNDGSTDNPESEIKPYLSKIKYVIQPNSGCPAGAKNRGIAESSGEYLAFLDQDDLWLKDKLAEQAKILDNYPEIGLVTTNAIVFQDKTKKRVGILWKKAKKILSPKEAKSKLLKENFLLTSSAVMIRRKVLNTDKYFDDRLKLVDDYELWYRIAKKWSLALISKPLIYYRLYSQNLTKNKYKWLSDLIFFFNLIAQEKTLTKKERQFVLRKKAMFNFHLANSCMATNNFSEAEKVYQRLLKEGRYINKIKKIESLNRISPKIAGLMLKIKITFSERGRSGPKLDLII